MNLNRKSPVPLWVILCVGAILLSGAYFTAKWTITPKPSRTVQHPPSVRPNNPRDSGTATAPVVVNSPTPSPALVSATSSTSGGWRTYYNDQFHFEITVPDTFRLEQTTDSISDAEVRSQDIAVLYALDVLDQRDTIHYFGLAIGKSKYTLDQYERTKQDRIRYDSAWTINTRSINGIRGFDTYGYAAEGHLYSEHFDFVQDGHIYTMFLDPVLEGKISADTYPEGGSGGCCNDYDPAKKRDIYRTILASFRIY